MKTRNRLSSALLLAFGLTISTLASADEVSVEFDTGAVQVPVGALDAQFITKTISVRGPRTLVIHYSAECQIQRGHVEYDIVVHRSNLNVTARQTAPTNDNFSALCSSNDPNESSLRAVSAATTVACTVTLADSYTVKVRGHVESPDMPGPGVVDDQSLVITEHAFSSGLQPCIFELPGGVTG